MFKEEILERLREQRELPKPTVEWPDGCYGAINAPLLFVGLSPGGGTVKSEYKPRMRKTENAYWNVDYIEPFVEWSNGFKNSLKPIVESLLDITLEEGGYKLFAFANFDWIQNPVASEVPESRIKEGIDEVKHLINAVSPKIIVALQKRAYKYLVTLLQEQSYQLEYSESKSAKIRANKNSFHWELDASLIKGYGELNGCALLRSPQHHARIFSSEYAARVSQALRMALSSLIEGKKLQIELV